MSELPQNLDGPRPIRQDSLDCSIISDDSNMDNQSAKFSEDTSYLQSKTIVSFVIDDPDSCAYNNKTGEEAKKYQRKEERKKARHSASIFLSILYAVILILIGIVSPVSEALRGGWNSNVITATFMTYMAGGSIIVLVYLLAVNKKRPATHHVPKTTTNVPGSNGQTNLGLTSDNESDSTDDVFPTNKSNASQANGDIALEQLPKSPGLRNKFLFNALEGANGYSPNITRRSLQQDSGSNIPKLPPGISPNIRSRKRAESTLSMPMDDTLDTFGDDMEQEVAHFITLNTQTASFSHEGTSFYLRFGCLLFSVFYMMYLALEIEYYFAVRGVDKSCDVYSYKNVGVLFVQLVFVLIQTFFLFKTQSLYITKYKVPVRFGLMHLLATNLVVWIRALVYEIVEGVHEATSETHHGQTNELYTNATSTPGYVNDTSCDDIPTLSSKASSYLFPCILEYSLIAVATMAARFMALDIRISGEVLKSIKKYLRKAREQARKGTKEDESLLQSHKETKMLDKSHSGLYCGILVFTGTIVAFILFMYNDQSDDPTDQEEAILIYEITDIILCTLGLIAVIIGAHKTRYFRYSLLRDNHIDHLLLLLSLCGLMLYDLFQAVGLFYYISHGDSSVETILGAICSILSMLQALFQTTFITFGLQIYSHFPEQRREKPGRGVITFLIITNISFWFLKSFGEKNVSTELMEEFYGVTPWQIIMHFTLPFMLFFRFHSSVCLADMWTSAYENEESPVQYVNIE